MGCGIRHGPIRESGGAVKGGRMEAQGLTGRRLLDYARSALESHSHQQERLRKVIGVRHEHIGLSDHFTGTGLDGA